MRHAQHGPHITDALQALDSILQRMSAHTYKKKPLLRVLTLWKPDI
ncbi:MAG: hypothetical protein ACSLE6_12705 [Mycobacterium sp.]